MAGLATTFDVWGQVQPADRQCRAAGYAAAYYVRRALQPFQCLVRLVRFIEALAAWTLLQPQSIGSVKWPISLQCLGLMACTHMLTADILAE